MHPRVHKMASLSFPASRWDGLSVDPNRRTVSKLTLTWTGRPPPQRFVEIPGGSGDVSDLTRERLVETALSSVPRLFIERREYLR